LLKISKPKVLRIFGLLLRLLSLAKLFLAKPISKALNVALKLLKALNLRALYLRFCFRALKLCFKAFKNRI
jgi:hypothetical protein